MKFPGIFFFAVALSNAFAFTPQKILSVKDYRTIIDSMVPGAKFGISIRSVKSGNQIAEFQADSFFTPASTLKTLTTASALDYFPLDYSPRTRLFLEGSVSGKTFHGILRLRGEGDPNISGRYYSEPFYLLRVLADSIRQKGIDTLDAKIELDTNFFSGPRKPEHWRDNYYDAWYGAEVTPLIFNDNCALVKIVPGEKIGDTASVTVEPDIGYVRIVNKLTTGKGSRRRYVYSLDADSSVIRISGTIGVNAGETGIAIPTDISRLRLSGLCRMRELRTKKIPWHNAVFPFTSLKFPEHRFSAFLTKSTSGARTSTPKRCSEISRRKNSEKATWKTEKEPSGNFYRS